MSRHLERLLEIDRLLRSSERQTAESLALALEVSERTVRSDIAFLRDRYSAPIDSNKSRGFYYTDPHWRLPSINLSYGELFALTLGAQMLKSYAGSAYAQELQSAIAQLAERLHFLARGLHEVKRWVLYYGKGAIVQAPPELVEMVRGETQQMARQQERGEFEGPV